MSQPFLQKKKLIIVKLGGSIVTLKHLSRPAIRRAHIERIAKILRKQYNPKKHALILIHGAGSFGHLHAHRHALSLGTKNHPEKMLRAVENQSFDAFLNSEITRICVNTGLPVVGMPTRTLVTNADGQLASLKTETLSHAVRTGAIPLLHGDMVFDTTWGLSICSGDVLMATLSHLLKVDCVFFASDVDGIFSQDPHRYNNATLIHNVSLNEIANGSITLETSHNVDVTGGLSKKFALFQKNTSLRNIYLFNGLLTKNYSFIFDQKNFFGTTITMQ